MTTCTVTDCNKQYLASGYCSTHWGRWRKYGNPEYTKTERHGMSDSPEYAVWEKIKNRCYSKTSSDYELYGARGVKVCDEWRSSFIQFYKDMGNRPSLKHSIDRIDVNGNYEPSNCRWATLVEQANNKRNNVSFTINGITKTLKQWSDKYGVKYKKVHARVRYQGWSIEEALELNNG